MTIAVGFHCHEGVLLAADTLYGGVNKRYGRKLWSFRSGNVAVGFGAAGTQGGLERTRDELGRRLGSEMGRHDVIEMIEGVLQEVLDVQKPIEGEQTYGLFAIRAGAGPAELFEKTAGKAMLSPVGHPGQCVGWATALGQYFLDYLYREPMPVRWGLTVGSHLIKQAKTYSEHCGGHTQFLCLNHDGTELFVSDQEFVRQHEERLGQLDAAVRAVLPDGTATDHTLDLRLKTIVAAIEKAGRSHVVGFSEQGVHIQSGSSNVIAPTIPAPQIRFGNLEDD